MKNALINPIDLIEGYPSVVSVNDTPFETVPEYYWVECPDDTVSGMYYNDGTFVLPTPPAPTPPEPPAPPTADENKATAIQKLKNTDWVELPSVTATTSNPHLLNLDAWITYRDQVRVYAINPIEGNITWPVKPTEEWSS
jgi:hypothetical protein